MPEGGYVESGEGTKPDILYDLQGLRQESAFPTIEIYDLDLYSKVWLLPGDANAKSTFA
jgi:hypothetical protein